MNTEALKAGVEALRDEHAYALASFNIWEELQLFRSARVHGIKIAKRNVAAYNRYPGFFSTVEHSAQTETYISLAKMYLGNDQNLTIPNLLDKLRKASVNSPKGNPDYKGLSAEQIDDLTAKLRDIEPTLDRLAQLRNKVKAHLDIKKRDIDLLTRGEVVQLFELSELLLNEMSVAYWGNVAMFGLLDDQTKLDTQSLLELVKSEHSRLVSDQ